MDSSGSSLFFSDSSMDDSDSTSVSLDSSESSETSGRSSVTETTTSSTEQGDADDDTDEDFDEPLYPGAKLTFFQSYLQLFQYALRHRLTKLAFSDLLNLVGNHLRTNSMVSLYKLKKYFLHLYQDLSFNTHFCCSSCHASLLTMESTCPNGCQDEVMEFLSISVVPQLRRRLEGMPNVHMHKL